MPDKTIKKDGPILDPDVLGEAVERACREINRAENKHGPLPKDEVYSAAIVTQEAGEMLHDAVNLHLQDPPPPVDDLINETVQTAAMALRFLHDLIIIHEKEKP